MQQAVPTSFKSTSGKGLEAMRGPRVRVRLAASVGADLQLEGRLRPTIGLREGALRGRSLVYRLNEAGDGRRVDALSLNTVDAERVDLAAVDAAFGAITAATPGERPDLLILPVNWTTLRAARSRRRLLRRVAAGQIDRRVLALCEVTGLDPGVPQSVIREVTGGLKPIFRGVLARTRPEPGHVRYLADCGFTGASVEAGRMDNVEGEVMMLRRMLLLQTIGPGILVHGVGSVAALAGARAAGASWASLDIQPGATEGQSLLAETITAARFPGPPHIVDPL
jgi:hypothetical protein